MWLRPTFALCLAGGIAAAQAPAPGQAQEPVAEVIRLFDQHRIVMLGEIHESIQLHDLVKKLVATPAFAERVNDIVVEMGNARHQDVLDRYISGADVTIGQLSPVWQDVVATARGVATQPYHGLFTAVREANRKLPAEHKLRVLAGDPPIDWNLVRSREDIAPFLLERDEHFAGVVRKEVLAKGRRALLIMGAGHFQRREGKPGALERQMLDAAVKPYVIVAGSDVVHSYDDVDPRFAAANGAAGPWIMEMKGTWLGALPKWDASPTLGYPSFPQPATQSGTWDQAADAFLFLGTRDSLTTGGEAFDLEGTAYGNELRRRWKIIMLDPPTALPRSDGRRIPLLRPPVPAATPPRAPKP